MFDKTTFRVEEVQEKKEEKENNHDCSASTSKQS